MGFPLTARQPPKSGWALPKVRNRVDFPIPFIPTIAVSSPGASAKFIFSAIAFLPYPIERLAAVSVLCFV
ncbi:hypothetical protein ZONE111904_19585 [Zobellia nedashkovskayae]